MKNTVIFDLDGLLIESEIISYRIYHDLTEKYGKAISMENYIHNYSEKTADRSMRTLIDEYHLPVSVEDGLSFAALKEKEYFKQGVVPKQGVEVKRGKPYPDIFVKACACTEEPIENCFILPFGCCIRVSIAA